MAGFLELFVRYVDEVGGDPVQAAADRVRANPASSAAGDREEANRQADEIERIWHVLGGGEG